MKCKGSKYTLRDTRFLNTHLLQIIPLGTVCVDCINRKHCDKPYRVLLGAATVKMQTINHSPFILPGPFIFCFLSPQFPSTSTGWFGTWGRGWGWADCHLQRERGVVGAWGKRGSLQPWNPWAVTSPARLSTLLLVVNVWLDEGVWNPRLHRVQGALKMAPCDTLRFDVLLQGQESRFPAYCSYLREETETDRGCQPDHSDAEV